MVRSARRGIRPFVMRPRPSTARLTRRRLSDQQILSNSLKRATPRRLLQCMSLQVARLGSADRRPARPLTEVDLPC